MCEKSAFWQLCTSLNCTQSIFLAFFTVMLMFSHDGMRTLTKEQFLFHVKRDNLVDVPVPESFFKLDCSPF